MECGGVLQPPAALNRNGSRKDRVVASKTLPSPDVLRQLLRYDDLSGKIFWIARGPEWFSCGDSQRTVIGRMNIWNSKNAGKEAISCSVVGGYLRGKLLGDTVFNHRVVFALCNGFCPEIIDHINGVTSDNRIENLRPATNQQNSCNYRKHPGAHSEYRGVSRRQGAEKWTAKIRDPATRRSKHLGSFASERDAALAYDAAAIAANGEFATINFPAIAPFRKATK